MILMRETNCSTLPEVPPSTKIALYESKQLFYESIQIIKSLKNNNLQIVYYCKIPKSTTTYLILFTIVQLLSEKVRSN